MYILRMLLAENEAEFNNIGYTKGINKRSSDDS
jgi:hypothetical protein